MYKGYLLIIALLFLNACNLPVEGLNNTKKGKLKIKSSTFSEKNNFVPIENENDDQSIAFQNVMNKYCISCHKAGGMAENFGIFDVAPEDIDSRYLVPGDPENSSIYYRLTNSNASRGRGNENMPLGKSITSQDRETVYNFIKNYNKRVLKVPAFEISGRYLIENGAYKYNENLGVKISQNENSFKYAFSAGQLDNCSGGIEYKGSGPLQLNIANQNITIYAKACKDGLQSNTISKTFQYDNTPPANPTFSPAGGEFSENFILTLRPGNDAVTTKYMLSDFNFSSCDQGITYNSGIQINKGQDAAASAISCDNLGNITTTIKVNFTYVSNALTPPTITTEEKVYNAPFDIVINNNDQSNPMIRYTINAEAPKNCSEGTPYSAPFQIAGLQDNTSYQVKAVACNDNQISPAVSSIFTYKKPIINENPNLFTAAREVIESKCMICHDGSAAPTNWNVPNGSDQNAWLASTPTGLIKPGKADESRIITFMFYSNGNMPMLFAKEGASNPNNLPVFLKADYDKVRNWINSLQSENENPNEVPTGNTGDSLFLPQDTIRFGDRNYVAKVLTEVFGPNNESAAIRGRLLAFGGPCTVKTGWSGGASGPECIHMDLPIGTARDSGSFGSAGNMQNTIKYKHLDKVDMATSGALIIPDTSVSREGYRTLACEKLLFDQDYDSSGNTALHRAINNIRKMNSRLNSIEPSNTNFSNYPLSGSVPTDEEIKVAYMMFYNYQQPSSARLTELKNIATKANSSSITQAGQWPKRFEPWRYVLYGLCLAPDWQIP